jgi:proteasome lid subunit RPN8/RPN11
MGERMTRGPGAEPRGGGVPSIPLPDKQMREIFRQAEAGYPEEICGLIVGALARPDTWQIRQVPNVANRDRQRDPSGVERDARTAYRMDDRAVLQVLREADGAGLEVLGFYHSHPDHDAYFSAMDTERATLHGTEPLWPGAFYLVVSVRGGRAGQAKCFAWDAGRRAFAEQDASPM